MTVLRAVLGFSFLPPLQTITVGLPQFYFPKTTVVPGEAQAVFQHMVEARFSREGPEGMAQKPFVEMLSEVGVGCLVW